MPEARYNTLPRDFSIKSQKLLTTLMADGKWLKLYPLSCKYLILPELPEQNDTDVKYLFVARKKLFRHAVERNRRKRLMREAVRTRHHDLINACREQGKKICVALFFIAKQEETFDTVDNAVRELMKTLRRKVSDNGDK